MNDQLPRKLAAILYADVAGYSRLTALRADCPDASVERAAPLFASFATAQVSFLLVTLRDACLPAERAEEAGNS